MRVMASSLSAVSTDGQGQLSQGDRRVDCIIKGGLARCGPPISSPMIPMIPCGKYRHFNNILVIHNS